LNIKDRVGKFDFKNDEGFFLSYSNSRMSIVEEAICVRFNNFKSINKLLKVNEFVKMQEFKNNA